MKSFLIIFALAISNWLYPQLSLQVKELCNVDSRKYAPNHEIAKKNEGELKGHVLEFILTNFSNKQITMPIDTTNYALTFSPDLSLYHTYENLSNKPHLDNSLGVYAFVYQQQQFKEWGKGNIDYIDSSLIKIDSIANKTDQETKIWGKKFGLSNLKIAAYNKYLMHNFITINPKKIIKFRIYFNPYLKMPFWYSDMDAFFLLDRKIPYSATFKIIINKYLYGLLTPKQRKKLKNLYTGIITSNTLTLTTIQNKNRL